MTRGPVRQRGVALLGLLAVFAIGATWFLVSRLNAETATLDAVRKQRNAAVLNRAKQVLIGYVAAQAANTKERNPGALPCPEDLANFDSTEGNEGKAGTGCGTTSIGRFPWRTLGTEMLVDAAGEPLWYVLGPGWGLASSTTNTTINSDSIGQLTVDGAANAAVALIIAPGPAFSAPEASGCSPKEQVRPSTGTPDVRNYLECENTGSAGTSFVTSKPPIIASGTNARTEVLNDQVIMITAADVLPAIEAAIADRIEREIAPALKTVYAASTWHSSLSASNPLMPYPAPFTNPSTASYQGATSTYDSTSDTYAGLLPLNQTRDCTPATDPRCTTTLLSYSKSGNDVKTGGSGSIRTQSTCTWKSSAYVCTGEYANPSISVTVSIRIANVAMGLRTYEPTAEKFSFTAVDDVGNGWSVQTIPFTTGMTLNSDGSATITVAGGMLPDIGTAGWGTYANYIVSIDRTVFGDHPLVSATDPTTGWFVRNKWHELVYYGVASGRVAANLPALGCATCIGVSNISGSQRAILILAGRSINGSARPSSALADYLEFGNAARRFEKQQIARAVDATQKSPFNDRIIIVETN